MIEDGYCVKCGKAFKVGDTYINVSVEKITDLDENCSLMDILEDELYYHVSCFLREHWKIKIPFILIGLRRNSNGKAQESSCKNQ